MAEKIAALKNKSFGKTMGGEAFSQKQFSPIIIHNTNAETVEDVNVVCPQSSGDSVENLTANIEKLTVESVNESITTYSSPEMLSIRDSKSSEDWIFYARMKSEWDTKNSPFEFDSELKIPFELQLRVLRTRESEKLRQRQEMLGIVKPKKMEKEEKIKTMIVVIWVAFLNV
uniref:Uncharacterized protein n=1 Tax=Panagrolaimus superbus TaxID=310955 RepID=A0A914Y9I9_9BILA